LLHIIRVFFTLPKYIFSYLKQMRVSDTGYLIYNFRIRV